MSRPATRQQADKAFFDERGGDLCCSPMPPPSSPSRRTSRMSGGAESQRLRQRFRSATRGAHSGLEFRPNHAYPDVMDDPLPLAPPGWLEALAESEAELAAGLTVPSEPIMQRLRETIARLEAKRAGATAPTDTSRR